MEKIIKLDSQYIREIIELEKENTPEDHIYLKYSKKELAEMFSEEKYKVYGIIFESKLIGWGAIEKKDKGKFDIISLVVDKAQRGKGLGKKLFKYLINEIKKIDETAKIFLTVHPENTAPLELYKKIGFVQYDFKKDYFGPKSDRIFMKLE